MASTFVSQQQHWSRGAANNLHDAASAGSTERTLALLASGVSDINEGDPQGMTPLLVGAFRGFSQVVEILLNEGANASIEADHGYTALHFSSHEGHPSIAKLLLKAGADVNATTSDGSTALHLASRGGHVAVVKALIKKGANANTRLLGSGDTPLHLAACEGHVDAVRVPLRAKANALLPRVGSGIEMLPLDAAARFGHVNVVRELLQQLGIEGCGGVSAGRHAFAASVYFVGPSSSRIARMLVNAGMGATAPVRVIYNTCGEAYNDTLLAHTNRMLREKMVVGIAATEEQLSGLEGVRRLLLRVEAVHAVS